MDNNPYLTQYRDIVMKIRLPEGEGPHQVLLLLHGWTGDEDVMWIFASRLPKNYLMVAPRGLFRSPLGGYGWHEHRRQEWPSLGEFTPAVEALSELVGQGNGGRPALMNALEEIPGGGEISSNLDFSAVSLVGFSQGAALSYSFALNHPERVHLLAGLAGFIPEDVDDKVEKRVLEGKHIFVTHGTEDHMVPIEKARHTVELLERAGSQVTYCEEKAGHKLSAPCFRALESYFTKNSYRGESRSSTE